MRTRDAGDVARMLNSVLTTSSTTKIAIHRASGLFHRRRGVGVGGVVWGEVIVVTALPAQLLRLKIERKNRNTLRTSRKIDAARSGAVRMSSLWRSRWKSKTVSPAKITRPAIE